MFLQFRKRYGNGIFIGHDEGKAANATRSCLYSICGVPGSAGGLVPENRTEGSTGLYKIVSPELPSIPFPVANPVAELSTKMQPLFWCQVEVGNRGYID